MSDIERQRTVEARGKKMKSAKQQSRHMRLERTRHEQSVCGAACRGRGRAGVKEPIGTGENLAIRQVLAHLCGTAGGVTIPAYFEKEAQRETNREQENEGRPWKNGHLV